MHLNGIKITWLGHATFRIETPRGKIILVDPWIMGNPICPEKEKEIKKVDVMLCTHGHFDHIGDAYTMSPREAAYACKLLKPKTVIPMHFGTFPLLTGKPADLQKLAPDVEVVELKPGVTVS